MVVSNLLDVACAIVVSVGYVLLGISVTSATSPPRSTLSLSHVLAFAVLCLGVIVVPPNLAIRGILLLACITLMGAWGSPRMQHRVVRTIQATRPLQVLWTSPPVTLGVAIGACGATIYFLGRFLWRI